MAIKFSPKQIDTIRASIENIRFELNEGTVRSGKTTADIFKMAAIYVASPDKNHMVLAYNQEQAFRMFMDGDGFGLAHIFPPPIGVLRDDKHGAHLKISTPNGEKKIYYKGAGKANGAGAIRGMSLGTVTFLEYDLLHPEVIEEAFKRTIAAKWRFHLGEQNPPAPNHPNLEKLKRFEKNGTYKFRHWRPQDNPVLDDKRLKELEAELSQSDYLYRRDWLGERVMPQGAIYSSFDKDKHLINQNQIKGRVIESFFVADGGQSDATSCSFNVVTFCNKTNQHYLYRMANYYHSGTDTGVTKAMSIYARELKDFIEWCYTKWADAPKHSHFFVDPACKALREELHLISVMTDKADNNSRDKVTSNGTKIEVGIERTQSALAKGQLHLVEPGDLHDHYYLLREIGMYVRNDQGYPVDAYNHALDELRYAVNFFFRKYILPRGG